MNLVRQKKILSERLNLMPLILVFILFALPATSAFSQVLAQWRGDEHRGIYPESAIASAWPESGPRLLWSSEMVGDGYGSPVILDGKLYICGAVDSNATLFVFSLDGKLLNSIPYGKEWMVNYIGCRNAPTITKDEIYLSTGLGDLVCLERNNYTLKWKVDGKSGFHNTLPLFGHAESPAVDGDLVFFNPGGKDTNVVALNRFTGKIVWVCKGDGERPGYNSPHIIHLPSRSVLVTFSAYALLGIDTKDGKLLWSHPQINLPVEEHRPGNGDTHSNTIWYEDGVIYYIAGDGNGAVKLKLSADGSSIEQVWRNPSVDNYMGGFIKTGNRIYSASDSKKRMVCLDAMTGMVTDSLKCGTGTMISDGNMLYYYNQRGEMNLVRPDAKTLELVSKFKVTMGTKEHFSHPVIGKGVLYLRHGKALMAWKI
jgi:outer membrane protein assembly factor BamB